MNLSSAIVLIVTIILSAILSRDFLNIIKNNPYDNGVHPQIIATIGVFGTFVGISIGLYYFDSANIEGSVPILLDGMRTAFFTSIIGISVSAGLKYYQKILQNKYELNQKENAFSQEATTEDLIKILIQDQKENNEILKNTIKDSLEKMTLSLVGDGESTLIGQLKILRMDSKDSNNMLIKEFREFATKMAENNSKAFIEALNESMKDLNNQLQEQFGENFKQLNIAVGKLLDWQQQYKDTIIEVTENQRQIFEGINQAKNSLAEMADNSSGISKEAAKLSDMIQNAVLQINNTNALLEQLSEIVDKAKTTIPKLEEVHNETHKQINSLMDSVENTASSLLKTLEENSNETKQASLNALRTLNSKLEEFVLKVESVTYKNIECINSQINSLSTGTSRLENEGLRLVQNLNNSLHDAQGKLEKELEETLNGSLSILCSKMTEVSKKFAEDYTPLADKLNKVLEIVRNVNK